jgi:hypothetical protein
LRGRLAAVAGLLALAVLCPTARAAGEGEGLSERFHESVQPILEDYCYTCHGNGLKKGGVNLDVPEDDAAFLKNRTLWTAVLKNVRAGIMPPANEPRPSAEETKALADWIKRDGLGIDPNDPDPGRVTLRRLNRVEYRNTIRDLMGFDFKADEEFPPDDTGYGFDTIADVLTVSPLLLEKYLQAAEAIVAGAVPTVPKVVKEWTAKGTEFRDKDGERTGDRLSFYKEAHLTRRFKTEKAGDFRFNLDLGVGGAFDFDPGRCKVTVKVDDTTLLTETYVWQDRKTFHYEKTQPLDAGEHALTFDLEPLTPPEQRKTSVDFRVMSVKVQGPLDERDWVHPKNYERFFTRDEPPASPDERRAYAREVLARFTRRAFRRPADGRTLDRLVAIAEDGYNQPGKRFEEGVDRAFVAVLASPRFLFRVEETVPSGSGPFAEVDEHALAARLSYFLWSTMPDDELFDLADRGVLRKNLGAQVRRMLADQRSDALIENFTGQWLQARDVEGISIDARAVLARDNGEERELRQLREELQAFLADRQAQQKAQRAAEAKAQGKAAAPAQAKGQQGQFRRNPKFAKLFTPPKFELDGPLRQAMRRETEMYFGGIVREDRSVLDLIDSDYTYLNEKLAKFYGVKDVKGEAMRRVMLPEGSTRGGILTQGTVLTVTSNPTRTSPVKRGLFLLDNILGTPAPPPPADVPVLEEAEKEFQGREPTMREVMQIHRSKALCASCHARMDPLGLALEGFNAMGLARETERGQPIDAAGRLLTGETFRNVGDLKRILKNERRADFYRCLTEKLLTYALGRGLEYYDVESVDRIVERLEREGGRFSALLTGVIESSPFQKRRNGSAAAAGSNEPPSSSPRVSAGSQP